MGRMYDSIQKGIVQGEVANDGVLLLDRHLADDYDGLQIRSIIDNIKDDSAFVFCHSNQTPVIQNQHIRPDISIL